MRGFFFIMMTKKSMKYCLPVFLVLLIAVFLYPGEARSVDRLPSGTTIIKNKPVQTIPQPQVKTLPSTATSGAVPSADISPKTITAGTTLTAVGPRIDTSGMAFDPPKSINVQAMLSATGPRIDTSSMPFDPPKSIAVGTSLTAVGPR
jgi:hypothetical protein